MALLTDLMEHPLDRSYHDRAQARLARGEERAAGHRSIVLVLACAALGLLLVVAAQTLRVPEETARGDRAQLVGQIESRQKSSSADERRISTLRKQIGGLRAAAPPGSPAAVLTAQEIAAGTVALTGPGSIITLDDSDAAEQRNGQDPRAAGTTREVLTSSDLQILVNGLWQAGAEAISINGHRLTSLSAIRFAGEAILVDFRPIARPYVITAIGAPRDLWETFKNGSGGRYLDGLKRHVDMDVRVKNQDEDVNVPASDSAAVRHARPVTTTTDATRTEEVSE
ncbi:DUF881 domain-containing protein [Demetria terragena]|uniref:DUF881 domain-containing protein n=1 Tax=Demetria terragena TaxID=63959 RepID=UPI00037C379D|nr:DUF881 domain-containing protein [Demetria terragena]